MKIILIIFMLFAFLNFNVHAQKTTQPVSKSSAIVATRALKIGDRVPDAPIEKIVHVDGTVSRARISDFDDKLLILDFMYTNCPSCIAGLPKKNKLQKEFGDKVKIMVVVGGESYAPGMLKRENEIFIRKFLTNKKSFLSRKEVEIPWVVENKLLNQYFPHHLVSHLVWIYKRKVVAVTEQSYVTSENIQLVLDGKKNNWPVKNDFRPAVDTKTPLIKQSLNRFTGDYKKRYAAVFGSYQDGIESKAGTVIDPVNQTRREYIINLNVLKIYLTRWNMVLDSPLYFDPSRIVLEVEDIKRYTQQEDSKEYSIVSRNRSMICYESLNTDTGQTKKDIGLTTIADLDNLLGLYGRYEKRRMNCLLLVRTSSDDRMKSKLNPGDGYQFLEAPEIKIRNRSLNDIVWKLNQFYGNPPVFDESNYTNSVEMDFKIDSWTNIPAVRKALQPYGLDLKEEVRELMAFVLTEKDLIDFKKK